MAGALERLVRSYLAQAGLEELTPQALEYAIDNGGVDDRLFVQLEGTDTFQTRFSGLMELRRRAAGGEAVYVPSVAETLQLERQYQEMSRLYGLPPGFYDDPTDLQEFVAGNVSVAEFARRAAQAEQSAQQALHDPELLVELDRLYGDNGVDMGGGALTAAFLDPDRAPVDIERQFAAARLSSAARRAGVGDLSRQQAERLATADQGVDQTLGNLESLGVQGEVTGEFGRQAALSQDTLVAAAGGDVEAQQTIERRRQERLAAFGGGGGFTRTQEGFSGLR